MSFKQHSDMETIAIVGISARFPGAPNHERFWENLKAGIESVTFLPEVDGKAPAAGLLEGIDLFDAGFFNFSARETAVKDPQHRILLECCHEAMEHAGYCGSKYSGLIGIYAGVGSSGYLTRNLLPHEQEENFLRLHHLNLNNEKDFAATRVAYKMNLRGPAINVSTGCSTSLVAVHLAARALLGYECDMALAGAASISAAQHEGFFYDVGGILSPDGHCRPFDAGANGTVASNGAGMVVLKRYSDAIADNDTIHAVILGSAVNNDGSNKVSFSAPNVQAQTEVIADALALADVAPDSISYVEAHGTATPMGDPIEVSALSTAFRAETDRKGFCGLGSLKSNLGHMNAASGIGGFIKTVLSLQHQCIPPSLHFSNPNPEIDFENSPFYVVNEKKVWETGAQPRRAGVSSFGMGGTNVHMILEETAESPAPAPTTGPFVLPLSAKTPTALETLARNLADHLDRHPETALANAAFTLQAGREEHPWRRFVVAGNPGEAIAGLREQNSRFGHVSGEQKRVAFLFPGQGSQYVNMSRALYDSEPVFKAEMDACFQIAGNLTSDDFKQLLFPEQDGDENALLHTSKAQPAIFMVSYALGRLWQARGVQCAIALGHSIGELVAATFAGVFSLQDALKVVIARGRLMGDMPEGNMMSLDRDADELRSVTPSNCFISAINGPGNTVVGGPKDSLDAWAETLTHQGVAVRKLHTSHAFHTPMMQPAAEQLTAVLAKIQLNAPQMPFISNVTGKPIESADATDPAYWARHICEPVRFADGLKALAEQGSFVFLEVGPGTVLSALTRRSPVSGEDAPVFSSLPHPRDAAREAEWFQTTLGHLWAAGVSDAVTLFAGEDGRRRIPLPTYPFERSRYWVKARSGGLAYAQDRFEWRARPDVFKPDTAQLAHAQKEFLVDLADELSLKTYNGFVDAVEEYAKHQLLHTFAKLGWDFDAAGSMSVDAFMNKLGCAPKHKRQVLHLVRLMADWGYFQLSGEELANRHAPVIADVDRLAAEIVSQYPNMNDELHFFKRCWSQMDALFQGGKDTLELLFPGGSAEETEHLYKNSPDKSAMGKLVSKVVEQAARCAPRNRPLDILEVGGGVGGTTAYILPVLPADRTRYLFTDISRFFTTRAKKEFAAYPFLDVDQINLEKSPAEQGPPQQGFDMVIAANVLHTTQDLRTTLRHVHSYLRPGGLLVCMEVTRPSLASDLTFGFLDGWWRFTDYDLRPHHALAGGGVWKQVLEEAGYGDLEVLTPGNAENGLPGHHSLFLARAGSAPTTDARSWLILNDQSGFGARVAELLGNTGDRVRTCSLEETFSSDLLEQDNPAGVICTWPLDLCREGVTVAEMDRLARNIHEATDQFVGALETLTNKPPIWLVARNSDTGQGFPTSASLLQNALYQSLAAKGFHLLDLDHNDCDSDAEAVVEACLQGKTAEKVKWRDGLCFEWVSSSQEDELDESSVFQRPEGSEDYAAPQNRTQEIISAIYCDVFALDRIGVNDDFFELGGDSLLATQVTSRMRSELNTEISLDRFLGASTIARVSEMVEQQINNADHTATSIEPLPDGARNQPIRASFAQQRLWFACKLQGDSPVYNVPEVVRLRGTLEIDAFRDCCRAIIARHESLRTTFIEEDGNLFQVISDHADSDFEVVPIAGSGEEQEKNLQEAMDRDARLTFDFGKAPLMRLRLYQLGPEHHVFLLVMHHIISDGWSVGVLVKEWLELYESHILNKAPELPELTIQYADFSMWQRTWLEGGELERQTRYWVDQLSGMPAYCEIPCDHKRMLNTGAPGKSLWFRLDAKTVEGLQTLARSRQCSLYMVMLAAFKWAIHFQTRVTDIVVGADVANRNRSEIENLIGFFVNQLVLRTQLEGAASFDQFLAHVRTTVLDAYEHQDLPFDQLPSALGVKRDPTRTPLFQIKLVLQNMPMPEFNLPGLTSELLRTDVGEARFDILANLRMDGDELVGSLRYNTALYEETTIKDLIDQYLFILKTIVAEPESLLGDVVERLGAITAKKKSERQQAFKKAKSNSLHRFKRKSFKKGKP